MLIANCPQMAILLLASFSLGLTAIAAEPKAISSERYVSKSSAQFEIVLGRLQLSPEYFRLGANHERLKLASGHEQTRSTTISTHRGKPTLQFRDSGGDEEVLLSFKADHMVDLEQTVGCNRNRYKVSYHQPHEGPIRLRVDFSDDRDKLEFESRSLWHLAMERPCAFDTYLQPCLTRLEPSWQFSRSISAVLELMSRSLHPTNAHEVERLIDQLDADLSSERAVAMAQLESMGVAAEQQLSQSLSGRLSSQQETAIRRLLSALQPVGNDTPMRVAVWLSGESN